MSLPHVSQQQIDIMNKEAQQKYGVVNEENIPTSDVIEQTAQENIQEQHEEVEDDGSGYDNSDTNKLETPEQVEPIQSYQESNKEYNLRLLRERAERAERERDEMLKYYQQQQNNTIQQTKPDIQEEDSFNVNVNDEDLVEGKHLKELVKEIKNLRSTVKNYEQQSKKTDMQTLEMRLQTQFPDFNKVVTQDNLVRLRNINPDLADSILQNKDQFKQAKLAYEMVKQMGIYKDESFEMERVLAQKNSTKPRPLTSISPTQSDTPLSKVNSFANTSLSKELKQNLYQEMLQAMKGI